MNELCQVCINPCKNNKQKLTPDGLDCREWIPTKEWLQKMNLYPYWWVD